MMHREAKRWEGTWKNFVNVGERPSMQVTRVSVGETDMEKRKIGKEIWNHPEPVSDTELQCCEA